MLVGFASSAQTEETAEELILLTYSLHAPMKREHRLVEAVNNGHPNEGRQYFKSARVQPPGATAVGVRVRWSGH